MRRFVFIFVGLAAFGFISLIAISDRAYGDDLWVVDRGNDRIVKISEATGKKTILKGFKKPYQAILDSERSVIWVIDSENNQVVKLSKQGKELLRVSGFNNPQHGALDKKGALWVADSGNGAIVKISPDDGKEIFRIKGFGLVHDLCINPDDQTIWFTDPSLHKLVKLSKRGRRLAKLTGYWALHIAIDPVKDVCWMIYMYGGLLRISTKDLKILTGLEDLKLGWMSIDKRDGTCWVSELEHGDVIHVASDGKTILQRIGGFSMPRGISEISADGAFWVADWGNDRIVKLSGQGKRLKTIKGFKQPLQVLVVR